MLLKTHVTTLQSPPTPHPAGLRRLGMPPPPRVAAGLVRLLAGREQLTQLETVSSARCGAAVGFGVEGVEGLGFPFTVDGATQVSTPRAEGC